MSVCPRVCNYLFKVDLFQRHSQMVIRMNLALSVSSCLCRTHFQASSCPWHIVSAHPILSNEISGSRPIGLVQSVKAHQGDTARIPEPSWYFWLCGQTQANIWTIVFLMKQLKSKPGASLRDSNLESEARCTKIKA